MAEAALEVGDQSHRVGRVARQGQDRQLSEQADTGGGKQSQQDPAEALADARKALEASQAETAAERERAQRAEVEANTAKQQAGAVSLARISDHEVSLTSAIDSAKSRQQAAQTAYRAAREAGDMDAELAANTLLADATAELKQLARDKANFDAQKPQLEARAKAPAQQQQGGPTAEARAWIDRNPRYNADKLYAGVAVGLHNQAIDEGIVEGSRAYVKFIDDGLKELYGDDHGTLQAVGRRPGEHIQRQDHGGAEVRDTTTRRQASSEAVRGDRGGSGAHASNGGVNYTHRDGTRLSLSYDGEGNPKLQGRIPAEWVEFAGHCNMKPIDYAIDQIKIAQEGAAGHDTGLRYSDQVLA